MSALKVKRRAFRVELEDAWMAGAVTALTASFPPGEPRPGEEDWPGWVEYLYPRSASYANAFKGLVVDPDGGRSLPRLPSSAHQEQP